MYLFIFEDFTINKSNHVTDDDKSMAEAGYLDIIDIGESEPKYYQGGKWHDIKFSTDRG